jgi:hypothetical protein
LAEISRPSWPLGMGAGHRWDGTLPLGS